MLNISLWKRVAQITGAFAFIISVLLILNYAQYKRIDPVETELINTLVERLNDNPNDSQLREEIRTLDLLARKAYFTNQWQVRTGGYLLLLCIAVLVIAMQIIRSNSEKEVIITEMENSFLEQKSARKWISIAGIILVGVALFFAFLTHNELSNQFTKVEVAGNEVIETNNTEIDNSENVQIETEQAKNEQVIEKKEPVVEEKTSTTEPVLADNKSEKVVEKVIVKSSETKLSEFPSDNEIIQNHPTFRGPYGNGISFHKNIPVSWDIATGDNVLWKLPIPLHGYNSPIIWENKIFLSGATSDQREVYCIDRITGKILWTTEVKNVPGSPASSPKVTDDTGQAAPTLATDGRRVYAIFANGDIVSFDMNGKQLWARNLGASGNHYGHSSSLMLFQNILIIQYDTKKSPKLMGLSVSTGKTLWETPRNVKISWASPIVVNTGNKTEIITAADPTVSSHDPKTGKENWKIDCIFGEVGPSVAYADGIAFAVNEYARLVAIKVGDNPEIIWENDEYLSDVPSPVATEDLLFLATSYGVVICYDAKTGEKYWEHEFDNGFYSSPMMVEGKIYLMDMGGNMHIFKVEKEFVSLGVFSIEEAGMTTPAFSDGNIYIRGNEHLFAIGK